jgi:hypothetical protein
MILVTRRQLYRTSRVALVAGLGVLAWGCGPQGAAPVRVPNAYLGPLTVAVAPALNFSGSTDFDRAALADMMASELGSVVGVEVIPVSRVLAALGQEGREEIASPAHALDLVDRLGADAILVFAVTEYEPYHPPIVGIAAQLYGARRVSASGRVDPVRLSRQARSFETAFSPETFGPLAQSEYVFDASHKNTEDDIKAFAKAREAGDSPFGWSLYVQSQRHFVRYCCHRTLQRLFGGGGVDLALTGAMAESRSTPRDGSGAAASRY